MLKTSEVAKKFNISNAQVMSLVDHGYLRVAALERHDRGFTYLFADEELDQLDLGQVLAEIEPGKRMVNRRFGAELKAVRYYDRLLENFADSPCPELLQAAFYLFQLNHYAKKYVSAQKELYSLKHRVIKIMLERYGMYIEIAVLTGGDRLRVWLCDDCKQNAREQNMTYRDYIAHGYYCPKCEQQIMERDFYSLLEIKISWERHRFSFHVPWSEARRWELNWDAIPQRERSGKDARDSMFIYGRHISNLEERIFPLPAIINHLEEFISRYGGLI
ncbi:MAG: hypothetical protein ACM3NT_09520 [Methylocystaceae bacterium]